MLSKSNYSASMKVNQPPSLNKQTETILIFPSPLHPLLSPILSSITPNPPHYVQFLSLTSVASKLDCSLSVHLVRTFSWHLLCTVTLQTENNKSIHRVHNTFENSTSTSLMTLQKATDVLIKILYMILFKKYCINPLPFIEMPQGMSYSSNIVRPSNSN